MNCLSPLEGDSVRKATISHVDQPALCYEECQKEILTNPNILSFSFFPSVFILSHQKLLLWLYYPAVKEMIN